MIGKRIPMHGLEFTSYISAKMLWEWKGIFGMSVYMATDLTMLYELWCCVVLRNKENDGIGMLQKFAILHDSMIRHAAVSHCLPARVTFMQCASAEARI